MRLSFRIFFRHVEVVGADKVGGAGPILFVVRRPNGLLDPLVAYYALKQRVHFLARPDLFSKSVLGAAARTLDAVPLFSGQHGGGTSGDSEVTFGCVRNLVKRNRALCVFSDDLSHRGNPERPRNSLAARLALGARVEGLHVVPVTLDYPSQRLVRISAVLTVGDPVDVPVVELVDGEPAEAAVEKLAARIHQALEATALDADKRRALALCEGAEGVFRTPDEADAADEDPLKAPAELRQRLLEGHARLRREHPEALDRVTLSVERYRTTLGTLNRDLGGLKELAAKVPPRGQMALFRALLVLVGLGAILGWLAHYLPLKMLGTVAKPLADEQKEPGDDVIAIVVVLLGMLLFPLTWLMFALILGFTVGGWAPVLSVVLLPGLGGVAWAFLTLTEPMGGILFVRTVFMGPKRLVPMLRAEREAVGGELRSLLERLDERP